FNTIFILLTLPILLLLIIGTMWQSKNTKKTFQYYLMSGLLAIGITVVLLTWTSLTWHWNVLLGLSLGLWIVFGITTKIVVHRVQYKRFNFSSREIAMIGGHLAVALAVIGIVIVSNYQIE